MSAEPYKYKGEETIKKASDYLQSCIDNPKDPIPYVGGLAEVLDVDDDTIVRWVEKYPEFKRVYKKLKSRQKYMLMKLGLLSKKISTGMAIFQLKANHGMIETEKKQIDHTSGGKPIKYEVEIVKGGKDEDQEN